MSMEAAVVLGPEGDPIYWHTPPDRSAGRIPDSRHLWDVIWENKDSLSGIAHSHPGRGMPSPSDTDESTFRGIEGRWAVGRAIDWWIVSEDSMVLVRSSGGAFFSIAVGKEHEPPWAEELRRISYVEAVGV